jgi:hypothetical protein
MVNSLINKITLAEKSSIAEKKGILREISPHQQHMFISLLLSANTILFTVVERFRSLLLR